MDITGVTSGVSQAASASTGLADNFDTFLTLLTTQLKNQDPLEPMDSGEFTQQLVQFSSVEQSIAQNTNLETLIALTRASVTGSAVGYLGQEVQAAGDTALLENGEARWSYNLARAAEDVKLVVYDNGGGIVFSADGETGAGDHDIIWDGSGFGGQSLPDGAYTLQVTAKDTADNTITTHTQISGRVTAIDFSGSEPTLTVNGLSVLLGDVQKLSEATPSGA